MNQSRSKLWDKSEVSQKKYLESVAVVSGNS